MPAARRQGRLGRLSPMGGAPTPFDPFARLSPELALAAVRKRWLSGLLVAAAVLLATAFYTLGEIRIYRASATVQIEPSAPRPLGTDVQSVVDVGSSSYWSNMEYYATQHRLLQSHAVAVATVKQLALHRDPRFLQNLPSDQVEEVDGGAAVEMTPEDAASLLLGRLEVAPIKESRLVVVSYEDADPERAKRVLATLVDVFLDRNIEQVVASTDAASQWLRDQVGKLKQELETSELALHDYKKDKRLLSASLDDQSSMLREEMQQLNRALTTVQTRREGLRARYRELAKVDAEDPERVPASELLENPLLNTLRAEYVRTKGDLASAQGLGRGERHPEVAAHRARVDSARHSLLAEIRNVQGAAKSDLDAADREVAALAGLFEQAKQRALDLNLLEIEVRRLERARANNEKLYSVVLERSKESDLTGLLRFNNLAVAEPARVGKIPVRPRVPRRLGFGLVAGLALGFGLMLTRELFDRRVRTAEDLEQAAGAPFFGMLPAARCAYAAGSRYGRGQRGRAPPPEAGPPELLAHRQPAGEMAEAARRIRTNLLFSSPDRPHRRILITSAGPGDGKTMVASTLAISLAQAGRRVVLLDADLRRPRLHHLFEVENQAGISGSLLASAEEGRGAVPSRVPNLSVLPAGPVVATPAELLQSTSFQLMLDALAERYEILVIDSPPLGLVADAAVLAPRVDATLLVARAGKTSRDHVARATRILRDVGARPVGCVLDDVDSRPRGYGGAYYLAEYGRQPD